MQSRVRAPRSSTLVGTDTALDYRSYQAPRLCGQVTPSRDVPSTTSRRPSSSRAEPRAGVGGGGRVGLQHALEHWLRERLVERRPLRDRFQYGRDR